MYKSMFVFSLAIHKCEAGIVINGLKYTEI